jgi:hypothetical protein
MKIFGFDIIFFPLLFPMKLLFELIVSGNEKLFFCVIFIFEFGNFFIFEIEEINSFINKIILFASF